MAHEPITEPVDRICRNCDHGESRHTKRMFECGYVATFFYETNIIDFCPCFTFVPKDNLEYLELKVTQKENESSLLKWITSRS